MGRVLTNNTALQIAKEATPGVLPASPTWFALEPNGINTFGSEITTVARRPISRNRQRSKGTVVDLDSSVEFEHDVTLSALDQVLEGFTYAQASNWDLVFRAAPVTTLAYTIPAATANQAAKIQFAAPIATLVYARGYLNAANNGLKALTADTALSGTSLTVSGLVLEASPPSNATVEVAGLRAAAGDLSIVVTQGASVVASIATAGTGYVVGDILTVSGGTFTTAATLRVLAISAGLVTSVEVASRGAYTVVPANPVAHTGGTGTGATFNLTFVQDTAVLTSAAIVFTSVGLKVGQFIHVGGLTTANQFSAGKGYARIRAITAATLTLDKIVGTLATDPGAAESVDLLCGRFFRNVPVDANADDNRYEESTFQVEASFPGLVGTPGVPGFEYSIGNYPNELQINAPLTDKATMTLGFVGRLTEDFTTTRKTNAESAVNPAKTVAFNTSSDFAMIGVRDENGGDVVSCFKSFTLTLANNASPEKCLGHLGAEYVNVGLFEVNLEAQLLFTSPAVPDAIKNNRTLTFFAVLQNDDGAWAVDIASMTLGGGDKEFPLDQSVLINVTGEAFMDPLTGASVGISVFPVVP